MAATPKTPTWKLYKAPDGTLHGSPQREKYNFITRSWERTDPASYVEVLAADCEFKAALKLTDFSHYKSAHFYFKNLETGHTYMMQGTEMEHILMNCTLEKGVICGRFGWVKRGRVVSIKLLEELDWDEEMESREDAKKT